MATNLKTPTADAAFSYTKEWEGFSADGGPDSRGVPTYGYGYALIVHSNNVWSVKTNLVDDLTVIGVSINPKQVDKLKDVAAALAADDRAGAKALAAGLGLPRITRADGEKLFRRVLPLHEEVVRKGIGKNVYAKLDPDRRAALIDAAYQRPGDFKRVAGAVGAALGRDDFGAAGRELGKLSRGQRRTLRSDTNAQYLRNPHAADRVRVRRGESLSVIANEASRRLGRTVTQGELQRLNGIGDPNDIRAGSLLKIPDPAGSDVGMAPPAPPPIPRRKPPAPTSTPGRRSLLGGEHPFPVQKADAGREAPSPALIAMRNAIRQQVDPVDHTVLKRPSSLTEDEAGGMIGHDSYWAGEFDPRGEMLQTATRNFYDTIWGRGGTGKPRVQPTPLHEAGGMPLSAGRETVAGELARRTGKGGVPRIVTDLQETLNDLRRANDDRVLPSLMTDGVFGPKTLARLDEELVRGGSGSVVSALGRRAFA